MQFRSEVVRRAVNVDVRAQVLGQRSLVRSARNSHRAIAAPGRVLNSEMPQAANAQNRHRIAGLGPAVPKAVEGRHTRAHQWRGVHVRQIFGNQRQGIRRSNHIVRIAAVESDAGNLPILAEDEVAAPAGRAVVAVPAVPSQAHALARLEQGHIRAHRIHHPGNLVPRHARIRNPGKQSKLGNRIAVANAASLHAYAHMARPRLRKLLLHQFKSPARGGNLHCTSSN